MASTTHNLISRRLRRSCAVAVILKLPSCGVTQGTVNGVGVTQGTVNGVGVQHSFSAIVLNGFKNDIALSASVATCTGFLCCLSSKPLIILAIRCPIPLGARCPTHWRQVSDTARAPRAWHKAEPRCLTQGATHFTPGTVSKATYHCEPKSSSGVTGTRLCESDHIARRKCLSLGLARSYSL